jgi:hypothetical protein
MIIYEISIIEALQRPFEVLKCAAYRTHASRKNFAIDLAYLDRPKDFERFLPLVSDG